MVLTVETNEKLKQVEERLDKQPAFRGVLARVAATWVVANITVTNILER